MPADVPSDPALASAIELVALYRSKALSPVEATKAALARIERHGTAVNAWVHLDPDGAVAAARASEARWQVGTPRGLLDGVPIGVKDNILAAGMPARFGSCLTSPAPRESDAPAVARVRAAGAVLLGKTAMPEYGWKATSDSPLTGVTRNPWDTRVTTGGSSAGAVAATVLGMGALHLGTDGGGSIRIPAAFTGCFGIKPTRARVPAHPAAPLGTLAHVGPLARTVADAALALTVIAAPDARDVYAWPTPAPDFRDGLDAGVRGLRIALSPRLGYAPRLHPEVESAIAGAARVFEGLGAIVEEADPDMGGDPIAVWNTFWWPAMRYQLEALGERWRALADPALVAAVDGSPPVWVADHLRAQLKRADLHNAFFHFHQTYDLLLTPALPLPAFEAGALVPPSGEWGTAWADWSPFSYPFNLTTQPAASVPCGLTAAGLPVALQIVGPIGADALVLRAARAFEQARPFPMLDAPRSPEA
ncbi:MAG TPA: amidase [Hyphomicrobiaceae bacterium]|jgi:aspartyl-tRNA(Asn)/glutamyl-tRNA(Gln) amidotransferase subunit A